LREIAGEARADPATAHAHPRRTPVCRPDDAQAARHPVLTWFEDQS
jgi:hypothetical protein